MIITWETTLEILEILVFVHLGSIVNDRSKKKSFDLCDILSQWTYSVDASSDLFDYVLLYPLNAEWIKMSRPHNVQPLRLFDPVIETNSHT